MKKFLTLLPFISSSLLAQVTNSQPGDLLFAKQWYLKNQGQVITRNISELERSYQKGIVGKDINWVNPLELETKIPETSEVVVAVIDSGLDINHPDLKNRIWYNAKLCKDLTNTKNQPCNGWNFINNTNDLKDDVGHGTHVAGLIAANQNKIGITGLAPKNVKIMPLKVIDAGVSGFVVNGKLFTDIVAEAMTFAINNGASVINLSMGWPKVVDTFKVRQAFRMAEQKGVLVIAASGNNNKDLPTFPCSYDSVLCVGAIDNQGKLAEFSNHGPKIELVAPGEFIISTIPEGIESRILRLKGYDSKRGSSQASPLVAGVAATIKALRPNLKADEIKSLLLSSSKAVTNSAKKILFGELNMREALSQIDETKSVVLPQTKEVTEIKVASDGAFEFKFKLKKIEANSKTADSENVQICLNTLANLVVENPCIESSLLTQKVNEVIFKIKTKNLNIDSHQDVEVKIKRSSGELISFPQTFILSRDLLDVVEKNNIPVNEVSAQDLLANSNDRLVARLQNVLRAEGSSIAFFGSEKSAQKENLSVYTVLKKHESKPEMIKIRFTLPKLSRLITVHERDINFDGSKDYLLYGLNEKKDKIILGLFDKDGNPLFTNKNIWILPLSTFEGLPVDGNRENFSWLKIQSLEFGQVLVPSFLRNYSTPDLDNSTNILDRLLGARNHFFYFEPKINQETNEVILGLRVLDSYSVRSQLIKQISAIDDPELILLDRLLPQTESEKNQGIVSATISLQTESLGNSYIFKVTEVKNGKAQFSLETIQSMVPGLSQSVVIPVLNQENKIQEELVLTSLLNRTSTRNLFFDKNTNSENANIFFQSQSYDDPVINLTGAFVDSDQMRHLLVENRYSLTLASSKNSEVFSRQSLPVYRDSSFPGVNFSETLTPFRVNSAPSLFINSTLIFGDRLYVASLVEGKFIRPIRTSITIPKSCANLGLQDDGGGPSISMLCLEKNNALNLLIFPLNND